MSRREVCLALLVLALGFGAAWDRVYPPTAVTSGDAELMTALTQLFELRAKAVVSHNPARLKPYYNLSSRTAQYAFEHEVTRTAYLKAWEVARATQFVACNARIRVTRLRDKGGRKAVNLRQTAFFDYVYVDDPGRERSTFAVDTLHTLELEKRGPQWTVVKEWYLDPLKEDTIVPDVSPQAAGPPAATQMQASTAEGATSSGRYRRDGAVTYANEYCGVALTPKGRHLYSPAYHNYNGRGGDCTNFVSQVLHEGGGIPMGGGWQAHNGKGSKAWVHTDSLARHLMYSGRAQRIARGTLQTLMTPTAKYPLGPIGALEGGDLVAYEEKGDIVHFAVVVGRDSRGYVLVNSHTADRYRVPWDLGWDQATVFWLMKVVY